MQALEVEVEVAVEVEVEVELVQGHQWPAELVRELVLAHPQVQLVWVADNGAHALSATQWAELVLAQPPLEQGRQRPAELVHEHVLAQPPLKQVQLVCVEDNLLSRQWPA